MVILQSIDIVRQYFDKKQRPIYRYNQLLSVPLSLHSVCRVSQTGNVVALDLFTSPVAYKSRLFEHVLYPYNKVVTVVLIHV